ncbi:MAG: flavodoxin-dependent (E)-4-hydroxy-3-methylbut-2-enyl-diphosphate synthase, partial [Cetobacterium sp.]
MRESKVVKIGELLIGGGNEVVIQSMTNTPTHDVDRTVAQIRKLQEEGCQLVRVTVNTELAARAIKEIKERIDIPLVADIHFDYKLALLAIENGIDKLRINPGNIGDDE